MRGKSSLDPNGYEYLFISRFLSNLPLSLVLFWKRRGGTAETKKNTKKITNKQQQQQQQQQQRIVTQKQKKKNLVFYSCETRFGLELEIKFFIIYHILF